MSQPKVLLFTLLVISHLLIVASQPADLGTFGSHNEHPNGISSFTLPAEERIISEPYVLAYINYNYTTAEGLLVQTNAEERGKYGEGRIFTVSGQLIHISSRDDKHDHTACDMRLISSTGHSLPAGDRPWIALIKRGGCNFEDKVRHAYEHKAAGVIVYNDRDTNSLDKMKILDTDRAITAVFTFKWLGDQMARLIDEGNELNATISEGRYSKVVTNINRTSVLFVSVSFIVLMIISLVWLIFYYVQRFRYLQTKDRKSRQLCSVAKRIIAKIPTKNIKSDDKEIENDCCAICIEIYKVTDLIRMLPCRHEFHKNCIDPWLLEHRTCPMCKMDILRHYGFVVGQNQSSINAPPASINNSSSNNGRLNTNSSSAESDSPSQSRQVTDV